MAARNLGVRGNRNLDWNVMVQRLQPVQVGPNRFEKSEDFKELQKLQKLKFKVKYTAKGDKSKLPFQYQVF